MRSSVLVAAALVCLLSSAFTREARSDEVRVGLSTTMQFDSNQRGTRINPISDGRYILRPRVVVDGERGRFSYDVDWASQYIGYVKITEDNRWAHDIAGSATYRLGYSTQVWARESFRSLDSYSAGGDAPEGVEGAGKRDYVNSIQGGVSHGFNNRLLLETSGYWQVYNRARDDNYDSRFYGANVNLRYTPTQDDSGDIGIEYSRNKSIAPDNERVRDEGSSVSNLISLFAGWKHDFSPGFRVQIQGGPTFQLIDYPDPATEFSLDNFGGPRAGLILSGGPTAFPSAGAFLWSALPGSPWDDPTWGGVDRISPVYYAADLESCNTLKKKGVTYHIWNFEDCFVNPAPDDQDPDLTGGLGNVDVYTTNVLPSGLTFGFAEAPDLEDPPPSPRLFGMVDNGKGLHPGPKFWLHRFDKNPTLKSEDLPPDTPDLVPITWGHWAVCAEGESGCTERAVPLQMRQEGSVVVHVDEEPKPREESDISFDINVSIYKSWQKWRTSLSYRRAQEPDGIAGGGGTTVDRVRASVRWRPLLRWQFSLAGSYRRRQSTTETPETLFVAGPLYFKQQESSTPELVLAQTMEKFRDFSGAQPVLNEGTRQVPVIVGVIEGPKTQSINVDNFRIHSTASYDLTERSKVSFLMEYQRQNSDGRFYRTFDRYKATLQFSYTFDPIRF